MPASLKPTRSKPGHLDDRNASAGRYRSGPSPYGDWIWETVRTSGLEDEEGGWNQNYYINPDLEELIDEMLVEGDTEKKYAPHREIQAILAHYLPMGSLVRPDVLCPVRIDEWEGYTYAAFDEAGNLYVTDSGNWQQDNGLIYRGPFLTGWLWMLLAPSMSPAIVPTGFTPYHPAGRRRYWPKIPPGWCSTHRPMWLLWAPVI